MQILGVKKKKKIRENKNRYFTPEIRSLRVIKYFIFYGWIFFIIILSFSLRHIFKFISNDIWWGFSRQFVWDNTNALLGGFRLGGPRELRIGRHQSVHQILGNVDVRHLFGHQHRRPPESPNRHDESFLSVNLGKCIPPSLRISSTLFITRSPGVQVTRTLERNGENERNFNESLASVALNTNATFIRLREN